MNTATAIDIGVSENTYKLPREVLRTAVRSHNVSSSLDIDLYFNNRSEYYVYLHFFEFEEQSQKNQRWKMNISFTGNIIVPVTLEYKKPLTVVQKFKQGEHIDRISIKSTSDSDSPPMLNACEIYEVLPQQNSNMDEGDDDRCCPEYQTVL